MVEIFTPFTFFLHKTRYKVAIMSQIKPVFDILNKFPDNKILSMRTNLCNL